MVSVAAKVGALLAVAAAGSTSVWYFSDSIFGSPLVSISGEPEGTSSYEANSIGKKYGDYFLSSKANKSTWKKRFNDNKGKFSVPGEDNSATKAKDKFGTVTEAYSVDPTKTTALNKVCEEAYKLKDQNNLVDTDTADKYTTEHIWKFCGLRDIVTLDKDKGNYSDTEFDTNKIGGEATNKKLFVSTKAKDNVNDWFWDLKTREFWKDPAPTLAGNGQQENEFKKFKDDTNNQNKSIKDTCDKAYKKGTSDDTTSKNKDDALTFCSIKLKIGS